MNLVTMTSFIFLEFFPLTESKAQEQVSLLFTSTAFPELKDTRNSLPQFIFTNVIRFLDYHFQQVILSILNLHMLVQQFINRYIFSSIKEINWLIGKGMCILVNVFKHLLLRKTDLLKSCWKIWKISRKENLKKCVSFETLKGTRYIRGNVYFRYMMLFSHWLF